MFTTCIFCHSDLGANAAVEHFPVGRRLAFDVAKGRLWAVCRKCERWNLSPLETRWEAIEDCERLFRDTRLRVSTDNIGLARLHDGVELVRIGEPLRPEFAAWRYGDQFGRRRRRAILIGGGVVVGVAAVMTGASIAGIGVGGFGGVWGNIPNIINSMRVVRLRTPDGRDLKVRGNRLAGVRLQGDRNSGEPILTLKLKSGMETFRAGDALAAAGKLLPAINPSGGGKRTVAAAVQTIEERRGSEGFLEDYLYRMRHTPDKRTTIAKAPAPTRLALEMALHEEAERRAIAGELEILEAAWREADEIAGIADNLLVPDEVERKMGELKEGLRTED